MRLFWVVGEKSGDHHASRLITALRGVAPDWEHAGMGGEAMAEAGCEIIADLSQASLLGLAEVVRHLPRMFRLRDRLALEIHKRNVDLVVFLDFPDFNIALLKLLRKRHGDEHRAFYYISPQVWAWRRRRAKQMAKLLDAMAVLFPFELEFYRRYGLETVFFGHPLCGEVVPSDRRERLRGMFGLEPGHQAIALLPGSRRPEVERHLPVQLEAMEIFRRSHPEAVAIIASSENIERSLYASLIGERDWALLASGRVYDVLAVSRVGLVKSGTSTVEAALIGTPFAVLYRLSPLTYFLARMLVRGVTHIAMVNVLAGREVVPERIQREANRERLADDLERLWSGAEREKMIGDLKEVAGSLGEPGGTKRLAEWIVRRFGEG